MGTSIFSILVAIAYRQLKEAKASKLYLTTKIVEQQHKNSMHICW
jgi:hypothetical protein